MRRLVIAATTLALVGAASSALAQPHQDGPWQTEPQLGELQYSEHEFSGPRYAQPQSRRGSRIRGPRYVTTAPLMSRGGATLAAHALSNRAERLHAAIEHRQFFSHLADDVHRFADMAEHFHGALERGADYRHLRRDLRALEREFHHLQTTLQRAHNAHHSPAVQMSWQGVAMAYGAFASAFGGGSLSYDAPSHSTEYF